MSIMILIRLVLYPPTLLYYYITLSFLCDACLDWCTRVLVLVPSSPRILTVGTLPSVQCRYLGRVGLYLRSSQPAPSHHRQTPDARHQDTRHQTPRRDRDMRCTSEHDYLTCIHSFLELPVSCVVVAAFRRTQATPFIASPHGHSN